MNLFSRVSKLLLCLTLLWLGIGSAHALTSTGNNFTMISGGTIVGGANDVVANWDLTSTTNVHDNNFTHMTLSSATTFFGFNWSAHHIRVFGPGTYAFNTACTTAELETNGGAICAATGNTLNMTVPAGQFGAHMLFNWNTTANIDVAVVWNQNTAFGPSTMFSGGGGNPATIWSLSSTDPDGDGMSGIPMVDGAFPGFSANFNISLTSVPVCTPLTCPPPPSMQADDTNINSRLNNLSGCSLSASPVNPLDRGDWWLLLGFIAWMGFAVRRKRAIMK